MEILIYSLRTVFMLLISWLGVRFIGKKSIAEMTSYDLVALMLLTTIAAEPLVYKIPLKASVGVLVIVGVAAIIGTLSLKKPFYNFDMDPKVLVANGKINIHNLRKARLNIPLFLSELRVKGYQNISNIMIALLEPNGKLSVIPKPDSRPVQPSDLQIATGKEGLGLPFIIDGVIQKNNLNYANLDEKWLTTKLKDLKTELKDIFLLEMDSKGKIFVQTRDTKITSKDLFKQMT